MYEPSNEDYFHKAMKSITSMDSLFDSSTYQFLLEQFHIYLFIYYYVTNTDVGTTNICLFLRQNFLASLQLHGEKIRNYPSSRGENDTTVIIEIS